MAAKDLALFLLQYLPAHPQERAALEALVRHETFAKAAVAAGARAGFKFSEAEVRAVMAPAPSASGELSDADLGNISGGRAGGDNLQYMEMKLKDVLVTAG